MAETKNLCAQIPLDIHEQVCEAKEKLNMTTSQYITSLLRTYYSLLQTKNQGGSTMENSRTMAFQIPEEPFQRIKRYLERETARTGKKVTQREFVLGLIEEALDKADQEVPAGADDDAPEEAASNESE